ncbi:MAG: CBS domain-containing protein, partial [Rubrivivax sp.]|nr:CBS domain-containing protein [Rubrivivax sp.]
MPRTDSPDPLAAALSRLPALQSLDAAARAEWAGHFKLQAARAGDTLAAPGQLASRLWLLLSGSVNLLAPARAGLVTLQPGALFGHGAPPFNDAAHWSAQAGSDCELAWLAAADVMALCAAQPLVGCHLAPAHTSATELSQPNLLTTPVRALLKREPITVPPTISIREAAQLMCERRVSSVLIVEREHLFGLVTDRDLRNRALAAGLDSARPIHEIATIAPFSIAINSPAFDAQLLMARHNIHHVPVLDGQRVAGMITATDLAEQHSTSAVFLVGDVYRQTEIEGLARVAARVKQLQQNLAAAGASAYSSGHIITAVTDALTCRLLQLGEARFGAAPLDYAWVAAGSQARNEQSAKTDQDNG